MRPFVAMSIGLAAAVALANTTSASPGTPPDGAEEADLAKGEEVYARCAACHSLTENRTGPRHCGLFGRTAGTQPGFEYSPAMKRSRITWDAAGLDRFLAAPLEVVPGTKMTYVGVPDPAERANLIAYLEVASTSEACASTQKEAP